MDDEETDEESDVEVEWDDTRGAFSMEAILNSLFQDKKLEKFTKVLNKKEKQSPGYMKALFTSMFAKTTLTEGQIEEKVDNIIQGFTANAGFMFQSEAKRIGAEVVVE